LHCFHNFTLSYSLPIQHSTRDLLLVGRPSQVFSSIALRVS
jgi:hypothetical protein